MARKERLTTSHYASKLPGGVFLKWIPQFAVYQILDAKGKLLAQRKEHEVLRWKHPENVFAYIARRVLGVRKSR